MTTNLRRKENTNKPMVALKDAPRWLLAPVPLFLLRPALRRLVNHIGQGHPALFDRLGPCQHKRYLIDPVNLPFVFLLHPNARDPTLDVFRRANAPACDARIAGSFLTLLDMIDGRLDGDALFFSRELSVSGDIEAVVVLRNAMDDVEGGIVDELARPFGPPAMGILAALRHRAERRHAKA